MGQHDRHGHELRRLPAGIPEHQALVSRALLVSFGLINALGDVRGLLVDRGDDAAGFIVKTVFRFRIADVADRVPDELLEIAVAQGRDLAGDEDEPGRGQRFAGDAALGVLTKKIVQNGIRDLVANLVRVTLSHRL